jgi:beta-fructofuranosidase
MKIKSIVLAAFISFISFAGNGQQLIAHFPMDVNGNMIKETVSGKSFVVTNNATVRENLPGAERKALRFDGFSTFINAEISSGGMILSEMTASLWCAMETYPIMNVNDHTNAMTYIAGNLNEAEKTGFAFVVNALGSYGFEIYIDGTKRTCYVTLEKLDKYQWVHLAATVKDGKICLYKNGELAARTTFSFSSFSLGNKSFIIGKSFTDEKAGVFHINTINGLIDDIRIYSIALPENNLGYRTPDNAADLTIPKSRHSDDIQRPEFHALPETNWTNEPHGLTWYNGKYHIFFQKNANGPYMAKLHWGHLSSVDLIEWKEEKIALAPGNDYDIKGVWSGCSFIDAEMTGGKPNIFYTGVDYGKATINQAIPSDNDLISWTKSAQNPIIQGRPAGLSDDFRDPFVFKSGESIYMVVGTSKDGAGATTLHRYDKNSGTWSNDGSIFYKTPNPSVCGTFWEMPAVVQMNDGKWLLFVTNLGTQKGTETLYWVGTLNTNGAFTPYSDTPKRLELFSGKGYGLLSPSIMQRNGKTIAIGIVPDKLPGEQNLKLGWAHLYSLPREWMVDASNTLVQKPGEELSRMRSASETYAIQNNSLTGSNAINQVSGKAVEIEAQFIISQAQKIGFTVRKSSEGVKVYYSPITNKITVDAQSVTRLWNDAGSYNGLYEAVIPEKLNIGERMKLHLIIDHSIMDIFVNDKYASSIRIFPADSNSDIIEVFSEGGSTTFDYLNVWKLDTSHSSGSTINVLPKSEVNVWSDRHTVYYDNVPPASNIYVFDSLGRQIYAKINCGQSGGFSLKNNQLCIVKIQGENINIQKKIFSHY